MAEDDSARHLLSLIKRMEMRMLISNDLKDARRAAQSFDDTVARTIKRGRGERSKLSGAIALEKFAVDFVKTRKDQLKEDGHSTFEAWDLARKELAKVMSVSAATIEDWQRGVSRRQRRKPLERRSHRRRQRKSVPAKGD